MLIHKLSLFNILLRLLRNFFFLFLFLFFLFLLIYLEFLVVIFSLFRSHDNFWFLLLFFIIWFRCRLCNFSLNFWISFLFFNRRIVSRFFKIFFFVLFFLGLNCLFVSFNYVFLFFWIFYIFWLWFFNRSLFLKRLLRFYFFLTCFLTWFFLFFLNRSIFIFSFLSFITFLFCILQTFFLRLNRVFTFNLLILFFLLCLLLLFSDYLINLRIKIVNFTFLLFEMITHKVQCFCGSVILQFIKNVLNFSMTIFLNKKNGFIFWNLNNFQIFTVLRISCDL